MVILPKKRFVACVSIFSPIPAAGMCGTLKIASACGEMRSVLRKKSERSGVAKMRR